MNKVLVIGINPSHRKKFKNNTFDRLYRWMDHLGYKHYSFSNVIPEMGDYSSKMVDNEWVSSLVNGHDKIIALGGFASKALTKCGIEHFKMPHPSPRNRLLNCKNYEKEVLAECKEYLES